MTLLDILLAFSPCFVVLAMWACLLTTTDHNATEFGSLLDHTTAHDMLQAARRQADAQCV